MKPALILSVLGLLVLAGLGLVSPSLARPGCTQRGTPARDIMAGTKGRDVLCPLAGRDFAHGDGSNDLLLGGEGNDVLVAGKGHDILRGEAGDDRLFVVDDRGGDNAIGGGGTDQCFVDQGDKAKGCERIFRGHSISVRQYLALQNSFFGGLTLAEELIAEGSPSPVPVPFPSVVTVTATVTRTASFPPCTAPPDHPPSPC